MTATQLIEQLQKLVAEHGDLEVCAEMEDFGLSSMCCVSDVTASHILNDDIFEIEFGFMP